MKKEIRLQPQSLRAQPKGNLTLGYYLIYDDNTKRHITITGPHNNFNENVSYPDRMTKIFLTLLKKSGYSNNIQDGKIIMSYSDFLIFELQNFNKLIIENVLL